MQSGASFDEQKGEWKCNCGEPAPYLYFAPLDKVTGEPIPFRELKLAICRKSECEFRAPWGSREQVDKQSRTHDTSGLSGVIPEQQTKFENIKTYGDNNVVGTFNIILDKSAPFYFNPFETIHSRSAPVSLQANVQPQHPQATSTGHILGLIMIVGILLNYRRPGRDL
ncbi:hypothetical protein F4821DRAFT_233143 [Hypoxylon rubiginosum]|uniref:Uncharacterized protein n=1 Tax=Hypoxylon rubiginosum TaxID=110542 RepID=A0ACC0D7X6_9PEZI|nr:hypothetical protein F4821DRAFT_233143 [Hypoxylon rubiginosum]